MKASIVLLLAVMSLMSACSSREFSWIPSLLERCR